MFADTTLLTQNVLMRRFFFDTYIATHGMTVCTCPSCGYPTLDTRGEYDICDVCNWEDDGQDDANADDVLGFSPNGGISLTESRLCIAYELLIRESPASRVWGTGSGDDLEAGATAVLTALARCRDEKARLAAVMAKDCSEENCQLYERLGDDLITALAEIGSRFQAVIAWD